jgi:hypothetical protein
MLTCCIQPRNLTWNPPFFSFSGFSEPLARSLSSAALTLLELFFLGFFASFVLDFFLVAPPPRVDRFSPLISACRFLAKASSLAASGLAFFMAFFGGGEPAASLRSLSSFPLPALRFLGESSSSCFVPFLVGAGSGAAVVVSFCTLSKRSMISSLMASFSVLVGIPSYLVAPTYLLWCQIVVHPFLQSIANALRRYSLQVGTGKDLIDDCCIGCALLGGDFGNTVSHES